MKFEVNNRTATRWLAYWLIATNILAGFSQITTWAPVKIALLLCLVFLPGAIVLRLLRVTFQSMAVRIVYRFGLSILVLIISGLLTNQALHLVGFERPLSLAGILVVWNILLGTLLYCAWRLNKQPTTIHLPLWRPVSIQAAWFVFLVTLAPVLAAFGAFRLNNDAGSGLAEFTLCYIAALIVMAIIWRRRLGDGAYAWFIFTMGLSVLLMTSLRGWDIIGHDIEREFRVFSLTHLNAYWNIAADRNPYNACLSITILPEMLSKLLNISGVVVFKLVLQIVFAVCPVVLFLIMRRYVSRSMALFGAVLFICYPTFINDSAMLTRQGVAYLFFALSLYILSEQSKRRIDKWLFVLCAIGAILSHYSTAYMFVALFAGGVICKTIIVWRERKNGYVRETHRRRTVLTPYFAVLLFLLTFLWYSQITGTSGGLTSTLKTSFANIPKLFSNDNKSTDTSTLLFFASSRTQADLYFSYLADRPSTIPPQTDIPYMPELVDDNLPITEFGKTIQKAGIDPSVVTTLRQNFARLLQLLALFGVIYISVILLRYKNETVHLDYVSLCIAGILLLGLMAILPILSINYGILRAFQQGLIFLILPIVLVLAFVCSRLAPRVVSIVGGSAIVCVFLLFTGFFAQKLGGTSPSLNLNNRGMYYGLYHTSNADQASFAWLAETYGKNADVRAANFNRAAMHDPSYPYTKSGILPTQLSSNSVAYLDETQVKTKRLYVYHESSPLILTFPYEYYESMRNRVYSSGVTEVYR